MMRVKTFVTTPKDINREWWVVDAEGQTLGRLATKIATILRGKHKPVYTPNLDTGDYVVVVNVDKIVVTGDRLNKKIYYRHTGYLGGIKGERLKVLMGRRPVRALETAVKGMLPDGRLGRAMFKKLKTYAGPAHPHEAQQPKELK
jgi:large subunit ribosomal protein L13